MIAHGNNDVDEWRICGSQHMDIVQEICSGRCTPIVQLQIAILACVARIIVFHQVQHLLGCAIAGKMQKKVAEKMFHQASSGHLPCAVGQNHPPCFRGQCSLTISIKLQ